MLVAVGGRPTEDLGLEALGIATQKGFITVGDYYQTNVPGVYAIGDVIPEPMLAHVASKQGEIAVEHMAGRAGQRKRVDPMAPFILSLTLGAKAKSSLHSIFRLRQAFQDSKKRLWLVSIFS